jgi:GNAT acetyltransferase-like protein
MDALLQSSPGEGAADHPYASLAYARSLPQIGEPFAVPEWECVVLAREIDGAACDAVGPYPLAILSAQAGLAAGLERLRRAGFVSITLVIDEYHRPPLAALTSVFDVVRRFKDHCVVDRRLGKTRPNRHHRYYARRASRHVDVRAFSLSEHIEEWIALYRAHHQNKTLRALRETGGELPPLPRDFDDWIAAFRQIVRQHDIKPRPIFPRIHHETLAAMPGVTALGAFVGDRLISGHLWIRAGQWVRAHLAAGDEEALAVGAAYAVNDFALRHFADCDLINFGGALGTQDGPLDPGTDGLIRFKRGFCNAVAPCYVAGAVLHPKSYAALCARTAASDADPFFPAYRRPDGLHHTGVFRESPQHS